MLPRLVKSAAVPVGLALALVAPFAIQQNAWYEWVNALWLLDVQADHIRAHGLPTLFVHGPEQTFYAHHAFYAGFTLSVLGYPAALVGSWPVFLAVTFGAFVAGWVGMRRLAELVAAPPLESALLATAFVTTPYVVTDLYGRGAWTELVAVLLVPLGLATVADILTARRITPKSIAVLVVVGAAIAGTHNLTVVLTVILGPVLLLAVVLVARAGDGRRFLPRRLVPAGAALALGVAMTAAWLIPNLWIGPDTYIARENISDSLINASVPFDTLSILFSVTTKVPDSLRGQTYVAAHTATLVFAWTVLTVLLAGTRLRRLLAPVLLLAVAVAALVVGVVEEDLWYDAPQLVKAVQFPFRVIPYLTIAAILLGAVALGALPPRRRRVASLVLVGAVAVQGAITLRHAIDTPAAANKSVQLVKSGQVDGRGAIPPSFGTPGLIQEAQFRVLGDSEVEAPEGAAVLVTTAANPATPDSVEMGGAEVSGALVATNVVWSPFVRVDGDAEVAGRNDDGYVVVRVKRQSALGAWRAVARPACGSCIRALTGDAPWQLFVGRALTVLAALTAAGLAAVAWRRRRRSA